MAKTVDPSPLMLDLQARTQAYADAKKSYDASPLDDAELQGALDYATGVLINAATNGASSCAVQGWRDPVATAAVTALQAQGFAASKSKDGSVVVSWA